MSRPATPRESQAPLTAANAGITPAMLRLPDSGLSAGLIWPAVFLVPMVVATIIGGFFELPVEAVGGMLVVGPLLAAVAYLVHLRKRDAALRREVLTTALIAPGRIESIRAIRGGSTGDRLIGTLEWITGQQTRWFAVNFKVSYRFASRPDDFFRGEALISVGDARTRKEGDDCIVAYDPAAPERNFLVVPRE